MENMAERLRKMPQHELHQLSEVLDAELETRARRWVPRGYQRSTYMVDRVRGKRQAPRRRAA